MNLASEQSCRRPPEGSSKSQRLPVRWIVILRGPGFLEPRRCERLLEIEHEVFCADNLSASTRGHVWSIG